MIDPVAYLARWAAPRDGRIRSARTLPKGHAPGLLFW
ncbi:hypothetical protein SSE37_11004 [Sagittula stellata E-37]|uniref:Uncharacterized protein n=1 Tax=Sagittula stellata (strain ATCC 700073 / DSM 11524 / E-37) TaxID=388399 RepID=A3K3F3_SAGS3|nr:hypothetical protein SSE37_11004 [Sagittula stellata E-37]